MIATAAAILVIAADAGTAAETREVSFADRVAAQDALERFYYEHRLGMRRPFEESVPRSVIEKKVRTYLKQSAALERYWGIQITARMLAEETFHVIRSSRMPKRLRELFAVLNDDVVLIQECLVRPLLANRLTRQMFASDREIHAAARNEAESLRRALSSGTFDARAEHPERTLIAFVSDSRCDTRSLESVQPRANPGKPTIVCSSREQQQLRRSIAQEPGQGATITDEPHAFLIDVPLAVTDTEISLARFRVNKQEWDEWWPSVLDDLDETRVEATAENDGTLLSKSGIYSDDAEGQWRETASSRLGSDGDCLDSWTAMSSIDAPIGRVEFSGVWTGNVMVVWGGRNGGSTILNTGGVYNPVTDTWSATTTIGAPSGRRYHTAVWTGNEMIVWGGDPIQNTGGRYDPVADTWVPTATANAPSGRERHSAVWTGDFMVVWGGVNPNLSPRHLDTGALYDPISNSWSPTALAGAPTGRLLQVAVWTGDRMLVWGGHSGTTALNSGGSYDPLTDVWTVIPLTNAPSARSRHTAVWAENQMIVWGGQDNTGAYLNRGGRYSPGSNSWTATAFVGAPVGRAAHTAVWTGESMIVWGGDIGPELNDGGVYAPTEDAWRPTTLVAAPTSRGNHVAIWTGGHMIVWGGNPDIQNDGGLYDPVTSGDGDGDGIGACDGDCDDTDPDVFAGAPQICDGVNNDCNHANWPFLANTNEADDDGDTLTECEGDCDDGDRLVWATPGEVTGLRFPVDADTLTWDVPLSPGGNWIVYDTIRSSDPTDFVSAYACVESDHGLDTVAYDHAVPSTGAVLCYLVRAENSCPEGAGPLGRTSDGDERVAGTCP